MRRLQRTTRPDLKVVVMSATLDPGPVARYLGNAPTLSVEGRRFEVAIEHAAQPDDRPLEAQDATAVKRLVDEGLAFLDCVPGGTPAQLCGFLGLSLRGVPGAMAATSPASRMKKPAVHQRDAGFFGVNSLPVAGHGLGGLMLLPNSGAVFGVEVADFSLGVFVQLVGNAAGVLTRPVSGVSGVWFRPMTKTVT